MKKIIIYLSLITYHLALLSCGKAETLQSINHFDKYEMVIDRHTLDTAIRGGRYVWVYDSIYRQADRMAFDTTKDLWFVDCSMNDSLQHLYYKKNGKKIQQTKYPKDK